MKKDAKGCTNMVIFSFLIKFSKPTPASWSITYNP